MVLDKGRVAEYDSPLNLLADTNSIFSGMVQESGSASALHAIASEGWKASLISSELLEEEEEESL